MNNLDCSICGSTSFTEIGGLPVCMDCFYAMQEKDYSKIEESVLNFKDCKKITFDDVERVVYSHFNINPNKVSGKKRNREIIIPRQFCHHISKEFNIGSLASIGQRFGKKDHATVLHSDRTIKNLKETDKVFKQEYDEILAKF